MMKNNILTTILLGLMLWLPWHQASAENDPQMRLKEFQEKQRIHLQQQANLTEEEAGRFFPLFFELQKEKKRFNDEIRRELKKSKETGHEDEYYRQVLLNIQRYRQEIEKLENAAFDKWAKVISWEKIVAIKRAEMSFHRKLLRQMDKGKFCPNKLKEKSKEGRD